MTTLPSIDESLFQDAIAKGRQALKSRQQAECEHQDGTKRDPAAIFDELYSDDDDDTSGRDLARQAQDAIDRAKKAEQHLDESEFSSRWDLDDFMYALAELEKSAKDDELRQDLRCARLHTWHPDPEGQDSFRSFDWLLERLIEFLESFLKPEERQAREHLFAAANKIGVSPYGKSNDRLRDIVCRSEWPL